MLEKPRLYFIKYPRKPSRTTLSPGYNPDRDGGKNRPFHEAPVNGLKKVYSERLMPPSNVYLNFSLELSKHERPENAETETDAVPEYISDNLDENQHSNPDREKIIDRLRQRPDFRSLIFLQGNLRRVREDDAEAKGNTSTKQT